MITLSLSAQHHDHAHHQFTQQDTLRGTITPERAWWDLLHYHLDVAVIPRDSFLRGKNTITYKVLEEASVLQIDLQEPLVITKAEQQGTPLEFYRNGNVFYIKTSIRQTPGMVAKITVHYEGKPMVSERPPWSAALTWAKDKKGHDIITTTCQGEGASTWWPCKDHMYDEPDDGMKISVTVPKKLVDVSNGRLVEVEQKGNKKTYHWEVKNPINNYGVNLNIARYVSWSEVYQGENGPLDVSYYVFKGNEKKAREHFKEVPRTLEAFEHWFGPYPFYEDGFKLVEVPYPGMEHQSSVTYGNGFKNGYGGRDLSNTGIGLLFDFIIVHESGHEWFANSITNIDIADMWIHEGFTAYSENLFVEYHWDKQKGADYVIGTRDYVQNDKPIIAHYNVNESGSGDMYYKAANMLHTIRQIVNDDEQWRGILRGINKKFFHQQVNTQQIEGYLSRKIDRELEPVFTQYLRTTQIPVFEYRLVDGLLRYRWSQCVENFDMPMKIFIDGKPMLLEPRKRWQELEGVSPEANVLIDRNFYVIGSNVF